MNKIANAPVGPCCPDDAPVTSNLTFANVTQNYFTEALNTSVVADFQTWKTANPTRRIITRTAMTGMNGVTGLLVESTDQVTAELPNNIISQQYITAATAVAQIAALQTWKSANPDQKIIASTFLTGNNGETGYLVEYTASSSSSAIANSKVSQWPDLMSAADYLTWKQTNPSFRPIRVSNLVGNDGANGLFVEYTISGSFPTGATIQQYLIDGTDASGPDTTVQNWKNSNLGKSILRIIPLESGVLIEFLTGGSTPQNVDITQSFYSANPDNPAASTSYQNDKTANPTYAPVRLTPVIWGNGATGILAEYLTV